MTTIYHNPRCSKSRATLALLEQKGITPEIVLYLENPPDAETLKEILQKLALPITAMIRQNEALYQQLKLGANPNTIAPEQELIDLIVQNPILLERPIVVNGMRAIIGRPPENVLALLIDKP